MKIRNINLLLVVFILAIKTLSAQTDYQLDRYYEAEDLLEDGNFNDALTIYEQLNKAIPDNPNLNFKIGYCYLKSARNKEKSMSYLQFACKHIDKNSNGYDRKSAPLEAMYYLGRSYQKNYKFVEAKTIYTSLIDSLESKEEDFIALINHRIKNCDYAQDLVKNPLTVKISNLGPEVNSAYDDYSPLVSSKGDKIIFTSKRKGNTGGNQMRDGQYYEDIYETKFDGKAYTKATKLSSSLSTGENEAAVYLSKEDQVLLIYKDDGGFGNLYRSNLNDGKWSSPIKLPKIVNQKSKETHASLDVENKIFYFTSDRKGGYGGLDIYKTEQDANGDWTKAENLGSEINTSYDEDGVYYYANGEKLIFSSRGHEGMGGFDIFVSSLNENGSWGTPKNIGYPINTPDDNVFVSVTADAKLAYFSSRTRGGYGGYDLYRIDLIPELEVAEKVEAVVVPAAVVEVEEDGVDVQPVEEELIAEEPVAEPTPIVKVEEKEKTIFTAHETKVVEEVVKVPEVVAEKESKKGLFALIGGILLIIIVLFSRKKKKK